MTESGYITLHSVLDYLSKSTSAAQRVCQWQTPAGPCHMSDGGGGGHDCGDDDIDDDDDDANGIVLFP